MLRPQCHVVTVEEQLAAQARRVKELERSLQKERQDKASLEEDFLHVIERLQALQRTC